MKPLFALALGTLLMFNLADRAQALEAENCHELTQTGTMAINRCDLLVDSPAGLKAKVYVKAWIPTELQPDTPVIVFLHGRGYARAYGDPSSTMLEDMGLEQILASSEYARRPHLILAPQDMFVQSDTGSVGEDYWLGADGRDWEKFLAVELVRDVRDHFGLATGSWKIVGASMGAHGALKTSMDYPTVYPVFAALSPIFRSTLAEIPESDRDTLAVPQILKDQEEYLPRNAGNLFLRAATHGVLLHLPRHYIETDQADFGLDPKNFPNAAKDWEYLKTEASRSGSTVFIWTAPGSGSGHSMTYWRVSLVRAMSWLFSN
jgi:pimeloyl-ACP methyl ester carboxylesterase